MNEEEWSACTDLKTMLTFLKGKISDRKLRLFDCACGRHHLYRKRDPRDERVWEAEERYVDGLASIDALVAAFEAPGNDPVDARDAAHFDPYLSAYYMEAEYKYSLGTTPEDVRLLNCGLLRDIVGNPFRPNPTDRFCPSWNTSNVVRVAQSIYDDRSFDHLPILASTIEEAGCTDVELLTHCREPGLHVRGCWVLDLLLGKN
jgi:hypothetical protein